MNRLLRVGMGTCVLGALFAACSSGPMGDTGGSNGTSNGTTNGGPSGSGGAHTSNGSGSTGSDVGGGFAGVVGSGAGSTGNGGAETCAGETSQAKLIPLDMYLMLDSSGSMTDTTGSNGTGPSKWTAVTQALSTFFSDPQSTGLGVGLQHFPMLAQGVPETCTANSQCPGSTGPCLLKVCAGVSTLKPCNANIDCAGQGTQQCVKLGECGNTYCAPANGALCGGNGMPCNPVTESFCFNQDSCQGSDYAAPSVEITVLNGTSGQLDSTIAGWTPSGSTPTAPALTGAIQHAKSWANQNPTHTVVVVLATDGLPTECMPQNISGIAQIASQGVSGTPSVKTFAIGVFSPSDITAGAQDNLDQIASAGGTTKAFIIDTSQNVQQQFLDALNAIRGTKLACEYAVPAAGSSGPLDFGEVNVEHTPPGASAPTTIGYVGDVGHCDPVDGGWYYDVNPSMGGTPTKIIMCPATCTEFSTTTGGSIDIRVGCKTVLATPE
ncbi:MAG: VWA domain-containing protein [Minicystis sp.]